MKLIMNDIRKLPILFMGFLSMSIGIVLIMDSDLGLFPWGVFHEGLGNVSPFTFGQITSLLGFVILAFSVIAFKTNVGPGTFMNILFVGPMIDGIGLLLPLEVEGFVLRTFVFIIGFILMALGKALYISARLGAGPRDGLFVGVSRTFNIEVKYVKPIIEIMVLVSGYLLGGLVGVGTVVTMFFSGYAVQTFFKVFQFESRKDRQRNILDYFRQTKSA